MEFTTLALLLAQVAIVILVSRGLGLITRLLGQPMVIAEMVAGIVLGPSLFGLLFPHAYAALFPTASVPVLTMLSQFGLVLVMVLVGLELDPALLRGRRRASVAISHTSIALPFVLGVGGAWWLYGTHAPKGVAFLPFALFLGTLYAWLSEAEVDLETMGVFSLIGLAYAFQFLWSPLLNRFDIPGLKRLGKRKQWMVPAQVVLGVILLTMSTLRRASRQAAPECGRFFGAFASGE